MQHLTSAVTNKFQPQTNHEREMEYEHQPKVKEMPASSDELKSNDERPGPSRGWRAVDENDAVGDVTCASGVNVNGKRVVKHENAALSCECTAGSRVTLTPAHSGSSLLAGSPIV